MSEVKNVRTTNAVEGFDPATCRINENGAVSLGVQKLWFRLAHPNGKIVSKVIQLTDKLAIMEARLYLSVDADEEAYLANSRGMAIRGSGDTTGDYIRQAEDTAIGQALANAAFGVQYTTEAPEAAKPVRGRTAKKPAEQAESAPVTEEAPAAAPVEETTPTAPAEQATPVSAEKEDAAKALAEAIQAMTLTEAIGVTVDFGAAKGKTLGQIAKEDPKQLLWFRDSYKGPDIRLRAAAACLLKAAGDNTASEQAAA